MEKGDLGEEDRLFEREGAKVVTDEQSLEYLDGSTVDYHTELIRAAFRIVDNPLAEQVRGSLPEYFISIYRVYGKIILLILELRTIDHMVRYGHGHKVIPCNLEFWLHLLPLEDAILH